MLGGNEYRESEPAKSSLLIVVPIEICIMMVRVKKRKETSINKTKKNVLMHL